MNSEWVPAVRYYVFSPSYRLAEDVLQADYQIYPRMPILKIITRSDHFRGLRDCRVLVIDPHLQFPPDDWILYRRMRDANRLTDWMKQDFGYLQGLSKK